MLKAIVEFSLRFRGIAIALGCLAVIYGSIVAARAKLGVFPEFAPPEVTIQTEARGLSSEQVEQLVTQRIENALLGTSGIEVVRSQSIQGLSVVTVIFKGGTDIFKARQLVSERLLQTANEMPKGVSAPVMAPLTTATSWILTIGLTSATRSPMDLWTFAYWTLRPRLLSVPGVAKISIYGGGVRELQVQVNPQRLLAYKLGINDVLAAARRATGVLGAGFVENRNQRIVIRTEGQSLTPEELGEAVIRHSAGASVRLEDVARALWAPAPKIGDATIMGKRGVVMIVSSQYHANTIEVTQGLDRALKDLGPTFKAEGITLHPRIFRAASIIRLAVSNIGSSLILGGILVAIVLSLFLFNFRTAFISLVAIPLSLLIAVIVLERLGATLNTITLGGLAIAIGEVVDDAIIDVENIFRRLQLNRASPSPRPPFDVILDASLEVRSAVVYATFVVALVFFPVANMSGIAGRIFAPLGWAYILAILASLGVALTVTPALCLVMLPQARQAHETRFVRALKSVHVRWLKAISANPALVIGLTAGACVAAAAMVPFFKGSFLPELRERNLVLHMAGIPGTSIRESVRMGQRVTKVLLKDPNVVRVAQRVGRAELGDDTVGPQISEFDVELAPHVGKDVDTVESGIRRALSGFTGWNFSMNPFETERLEEIISGETADVAVKIFGNDLSVLDSKAEQVARVLNGIKGAVDVTVASPGGMPEMAVDLRPERLTQFGFTPVGVLQAISAAYQGTSVAQVYQGNRSFDVAVILDPADRREPESVKSLMIRNRSGDLFPLRELATVKPVSGRYAVLHEGGRRLQTVTCNVRGRDVQSFDAQARRRIAKRVVFPPGVYLEFAGTAEARAKAEYELLLNSLIAAVVIVSLLYIAFGSLRNLLLVLVNVPFALVGGIVAATLMGGYLSLGSLVGFVTLFGITTRNSIMMISHFDHLVSEEGMSWGPEAALRGASERLLPILMTALVTALGLLPLAIGSGAPGREIEGPMAIIILGGLVSSTALNLLVLPTLALRWGHFSAEPAGRPD
jgi:CzcA family heavy metal efflux pump